MTFTETDLANLKAALVSGATRVQIGDRMVEYRSQKELLEVIKMVEASLAEPAPEEVNPNVIQVSFSRGSR